MTELTLNVPDISCDHCKSSIEGAVGELQGVERVEVSVEQRTVDVAFDDPVTEQSVVAAIEGQGYVVT